MPWAPDYITLAELKKLVNVDDVVDDDFLALIPGSASRAIDRSALRQFGVVDAPQERTYRVEYRRSIRRWWAPIDDLQTTTGLALPSAVTDYRLEPRNAVAKGKAWTHISMNASPVEDEDGLFAMTALWGWSLGVPDAVKLATDLQANRWSSRKDSPFGIAGSPDQGSELRLLAKVDPDVATSIRDYRRDWWAA